jgi:hypothetical protein
MNPSLSPSFPLQDCLLPLLYVKVLLVPPSCVSMEFLDLSFKSWLGVQSAIRQWYGELVNYFLIEGLKEFFMVVSVGRCKYQLSKLSVGLTLQATLGGTTIDFRPKHLFGRVFKFFVASSKVGFHVLNDLKFFSCEKYKILFHRWCSLDIRVPYFSMGRRSAVDRSGE